MIQCDLPLCRADLLQEDDLVDLEGDLYADTNSEHPEFEFELQRVVSVEKETNDCVLVHFTGLSVGFPVAHQLRHLRVVVTQ